jgi:Major surface glycoprotein
MLSLSSTDLGSADLYVSLVPLDEALGMNASDIAPNPLVSSSYAYCTAGSEDDVVNLLGPFANETLVLITVKALTDVSLNLIASTSNSVVTVASVSQKCHNLTQKCHNLTQKCHNLTQKCHNLTRNCNPKKKESVLKTRNCNPRDNLSTVLCLKDRWCTSGALFHPLK